MKAYLYEAGTGIYEGETFEEAAMLQHDDGITTVPPPEYGPGHVAVFDRERQVWELVPIGIARQLLNLPANSALENGHDRP